MVFMEERERECVCTLRDLFQILQLKSLKSSRLNITYGVAAPQAFDPLDVLLKSNFSFYFESKYPKELFLISYS